MKKFTVNNEKNLKKSNVGLMVLILVIGILSIIVLEAASAASDNVTTVNDTSTPIADTSTPIADTSTPIVDTSAPIVDASTPIVDTSTPIADASTQVIGNGNGLSKKILDKLNKRPKYRKITSKQRMIAANKILQARQKTGTVGIASTGVTTAATGVTDYFGLTPNYANSPLPIIDPSGNVTGGIRKFVDSLPGLGPTGANNLGQYIPVAVADNTSFPGSDYYEIGLVQYTEKMHSDLNPTTLRGYVQLETPNNVGISKHIPLTYPNGAPILNAAGVQVLAVDNPHYLGPLVVAQKNVPVRVRFINYLQAGSGGNLFIPVDTTVTGAGPFMTNFTGPMISGMFAQNRATLHLHGGNTPWISDGTEHQWTTPAGENTPYPEGVSVKNVPDMDNGSEPQGTLTFYYTNQQSARLMFYHDHAYGITRLNVYVGEAAGYLESDSVEQALINQGVLPDIGIPLIIQDKTYLPSTTQLNAEDPTWPFTQNTSASDLWFPHVYMPNQNPAPGMGGANAMGRWDYGPWFFPPWVPLVHGPVGNTLFSSLAPWENSVNPGTPNPSIVPEAFVDTPVVNGNVYPYLPVGQKAYRFRMLDAANDRMFNLQLYYAWTGGPFVTFTGGGIGSGAQAVATVGPTGTITGVTVLDGGIGYTVPPNVSIFDAPRHSPNGTGATATANISAVVFSIAVNNGGSGYTSAPSVSITGGGGSGAFATASVDLVVGSPTFGNVTAINVINGGTDFTSIPNVQLTGGGGTGANATATIAGAVVSITVTNAGSGYSVPTECRGTAVPDRSQCTEVSMVSAANGVANFPASWKTTFGGSYDMLDGRAGGIPNPASIGPNIWQIGTEGGFLPNAALVENRPVGFDHNTRSITIGNVLEKALWLGPAERADVIVDFQGIPDGSTLVLYNDAPAPVPAFDPRNDYYTNNPDQTLTGGTPSTIPGYGPNTRTLMQIQVNASLGIATPFNTAALQTALPAAYAQSQDKPLVPEYRYNTAFGANYPADPYVRIQDTSINFIPADSTTGITMDLQPKAIQELFEFDYGRMNALLGVEVALTNGVTQTTIPFTDIDPPTEIINNSVPGVPIGTLPDGTQIWKITHNGVDTHAIHYHMFNVQLINRVGWDGSIRPPNNNEIGWKDTVIMNPLEDAIVALRPIKPIVPWPLPNSIRPLDVTTPLGSPDMFGATTNFSAIDPLNNPVTEVNRMFNFGWEYVWHCHLLGHEENIMMRPIALAIAPDAPINLNGTNTSNKVNLTWVDNSSDETNWTIQRATDSNFTVGLTNFVIAGSANGVIGGTFTFADQTTTAGSLYFYRVLATNVVGDTQIYTAPAVGYPKVVTSSTPSNAVKITLPLVAPTNLSANITVGPAITLNWTDNSANENNFAVWRSVNGGAFVQIGSVARTTAQMIATGGTVTFVNTNAVAPLVVGQTYAYTVTAINTTFGLSSVRSNIATVLFAAPAAPTSLNGGAVRITGNAQQDTVTLTWTNVATNANSIQIQSSINGGAFTLVGTVGPNVATFTQTVSRTGRPTYSYRVRAVNLVGNSAFSNVFAIKVP